MVQGYFLILNLKKLHDDVTDLFFLIIRFQTTELKIPLRKENPFIGEEIGAFRPKSAIYRH
jgi:hypothetical protein